MTTTTVGGTRRWPSAEGGREGMKLDFKSVLKPTAVLFIICVVVSAALAGTNLVTQDRIAQLAAENAEASRGALITMLPILVVYIFAQKYFVQGIVMSGIKD